MRPNPRLQRTPLRAPLSRKPLGRAKPGRLAIVIVVGLGFVPVAAGAAPQEVNCEKGRHSFQDTAGAMVFSTGSAAQLRTNLTFSVIARDDEGECAKIRDVLVKKLKAAFPLWHYVPEGTADLQIVYESGFSLCVDNCDPRPLPQGADAELTFGELKGYWSAESRWRGRARLVSLFVSSLKSAVNARAA